MTDKKFTDEEIIKGLKELTQYTGLEVKYIQKLDAALDLIIYQKVEIETLKEFIVEISRCDKEIKSEAIKEFAERLKGKCYEDFQETYEMLSPYVTDDDIDNLLKEMEGE